MPSSVFCIASSYAQAETIVNELRVAGFANTAISVLFPDKRGDRDFIHEPRTKAPEGAVAGMALGGLTAGLCGAALGAGMLPIAGAGVLAAAGPLLAALSSAAVGAAIVGALGAIVGWRTPEYEARRYAGKVDHGNILLSVHAADGSEAERAESICERSGAADIGRSRESHVPPSPD